MLHLSIIIFLLAAIALLLIGLQAEAVSAQEVEPPPIPAEEPAQPDTIVSKAKPMEPAPVEAVAEPVNLSEEPTKPPCQSAHAIGFGFSSATFTMTIKSDTALNTSESLDGYNGIYFHYHAAKPEAKIYFSPNLIYSYYQKEITVAGNRLDSFRRYIFFAGNVGFNLNTLLPNPLLVEVFLEGAEITGGNWVKR